jgi:RND superfamily putative drug exporter
LFDGIRMTAGKVVRAAPIAHRGSGRTAKALRVLALPIILFWAALCVAVSVFVPPLEKVSQERSVALSTPAAPSYQAMRRIGKAFDEGNSDSMAMVLLESERPLDENAHAFYDSLIRKLKADKHVQSIQDLWGDPLTAPGSQSDDNCAAYVQLTLAGTQGESLTTESVAAVRKIIAETPAPPGVTAFVTGPTALLVDMNRSGDRSMIKITVTTLGVIFVLLLLVYRSLPTVIMLLLTVGMETVAARGTVAALGHFGEVRISTFAVNLLTSLGIAACTDYGIFIIGRYQEARQSGEDRQTAFNTMHRGVAHVILASGLTVAGALYCLSFARLPYFQTLGAPCAVGMLVAVAAASTLGPAALALGMRFGLFEPKRKLSVYGWRRIGTVVVRWPMPVLACAVTIALIGLLTLPGYKSSYNDREYLPDSVPANQGLTAAERHFSQSRMKPEVLLVESGHDMRNPADFIVLDKLAKGIFRVPGVSRVQAATRPDGTAMNHTSIPFQISMQNIAQFQTLKYQRDRMDDLLKQAAEMAKSIAVMEHMHELMLQMTAATHRIVNDTVQVDAITAELRDNLANFDDAWRPIRSYFYWEKHCYDIPICYSLRSVFDALDGVDKLSEQLHVLLGDMKTIDLLIPQMAAQIPLMIDSMRTMRTLMLTMHSTMTGIYNQMDESGANAAAMGRAFDAAKNDDSFYLPPDTFKNPDFIRVMGFFLSADGRAARLLILHQGDPTSPEGLARVGAIRMAAAESLKGTPLQDAKIFISGTAAVYKDIDDGNRWDLEIVIITSLCLIFVIMLVIIRALIGAVVIVGTVALSLGASFGLSILLWQHLIQVKMHWLVLPMSILVLLAVGSDYNLLLVSRLKEEISAGVNTGIIRAMGGTGKVVTNAGLVFALTMASMIVSDLRVIGQVGTTIGIGLLFDTLIVRSFMTPSIAALLGRWFWWPLDVRRRPPRKPTTGTIPETRAELRQASTAGSSSLRVPE